MTALLEKTHGVTAVYGYGDDRSTIILRDDDGNEISLFDLTLDSLREEVIEDYQQSGWLAWEALTPCAQDRLLGFMEEPYRRAFYADVPFAREAAELMAVDGLIAFADLTHLTQSQVDAEVRRRWHASR